MKMTKEIFIQRVLLNTKGKVKLDFSKPDTVFRFVLDNMLEFDDEVVYLYNNHKDIFTPSDVANLININNLGWDILKDHDKEWVNDVAQHLVHLYKFKSKALRDLIDQFHIDLSAGDGAIFAMTCKYGTCESVKMLVEEYGQDVNCRNGIPILFACKFNGLHIIKYLIDHGANVSSKRATIQKVLTMRNKNDKMIVKASKEERLWLQEFLASYQEKKEQ